MSLPLLITRETTPYVHMGAGSESALFASSTSSVSLQGCDIFKCASVVASCLAVCAGSLGSPACIACLGSAYGSCKDCF